MKKRILTGDRPTGPLHLGHYAGSLKNRVRLQEKYDCFFIISDYQFLTDHLRETAQMEEFVNQILLDWLSVGLDPEKSTFFIQSRIPEIAELTMYFSMLVTLARLQRNPTVKEEVKAARIQAMSYGFLGYPISQAADILIVRADLVPIGEDNLPHIEQAREIARTFNGLFGEVFPIPEPLVGEVARLPGVDGQKMSKSRGNAVYLSDSKQEVERKINIAITDPARVRSADKGHPDVCNIFQYYLAFANSEASEVREQCQLGLTGCVACKKHIANRINAFLDPLREKRAFFAAKPAFVRTAVQTGIERTLKESRTTMSMVRQVMHYDYRELLDRESVCQRYNQKRIRRLAF
jgi:tryptophanyl-tRNA synthetase